jgi:hypothetical protein
VRGEEGLSVRGEELRKNYRRKHICQGCGMPFFRKTKNYIASLDLCKEQKKREFFVPGIYYISIYYSAFAPIRFTYR